MDADIVRFVASYREPTSIFLIAGELETLGERGADWPRATCEHWKREITRLVEKNDLVMDDAGLVWIAKKGDAPKQMELF